MNQNQTKTEEFENLVTALKKWHTGTDGRDGGVAKDDEAPCQKMKATIYTISTHDDTNDGFDFCVGGSYVTREAAVSALVEWMMERLALRSDLAYAFAHDTNHDDMKDSVVSDRQEGDEEKLKFSGKTEDEVRAYIRNEIDGEGCYYIYNEEWNESWHFDLVENDIEINGEAEKSALINGITPCKW